MNSVKDSAHDILTSNLALRETVLAYLLHCFCLKIAISSSTLLVAKRFNQMLARRDLKCLASNRWYIRDITM